MMSPQARRRVRPPDITEFREPMNGASPRKEPIGNTCKDCRWAQEAPRPGSFKCRRNPPVVHQARIGESIWPIVEGTDYCGEFSQ